jgi:hypothetical protein
MVLLEGINTAPAEGGGIEKVVLLESNIKVPPRRWGAKKR